MKGSDVNLTPPHKHAQWDPFAQPLFDDPSIRHLSKVAVVDIGSNSVRLVVFDGAARSPAYFYNEKVMCGLGRGLMNTGVLHPEGRDRALSSMIRFRKLATAMGIPVMTAVATAAVRDAQDGPEFCQDVLEQTGVKIHIIDGLEEARLSAQGVLLGWPDADGIMCDIGGSSMELAKITDRTIGKRATSDLGPLKLADMKGGKEGRRKFIKSTIEDMAQDIGTDQDQMYLVGGSWRAFARVDMHRRDYPLKVLHEYEMSPRDIRETITFIEQSDLEELRQLCGISSARMNLLPLASEVLKRLLKTFKPLSVAISSFGIREGMLYEQMPQKLRDRDPLIESSKFSEKKDARIPGFGKDLYFFVSPLFPNADYKFLRLVRAACHLHDVSWRAHPDYRAESCFDSVTRSNLGGLNHEERVFLGLSLLHRYRGQRGEERLQEVLGLLTDRKLRQAEVLGAAMRLGAMLWDKNASLDWNKQRRVLALLLPKASQDLFGEVANARLNSLGTVLGAKRIKVTYT